MIHWKHI